MAGSAGSAGALAGRAFLGSAVLCVYVAAGESGDLRGGRFDLELVRKEDVEAGNRRALQTVLEERPRQTVALRVRGGERADLTQVNLAVVVLAVQTVEEDEGTDKETATTRLVGTDAGVETIGEGETTRTCRA